MTRYILRLDDIAPNMNWDRYFALKTLFDRYRILKRLFGNGWPVSSVDLLSLPSARLGFGES